MLSLASGLLDPNSGKAAAAQVCDLLKLDVIGSLDFYEMFCWLTGRSASLKDQDAANVLVWVVSTSRNHPPRVSTLKVRRSALKVLGTLRKGFSVVHETALEKATPEHFSEREGEREREYGAWENCSIHCVCYNRART